MKILPATLQRNPYKTLEYLGGAIIEIYNDNNTSKDDVNMAQGFRSDRPTMSNLL